MGFSSRNGSKTTNSSNKKVEYDRGYVIKNNVQIFWVCFFPDLHPQFKIMIVF